MSKQPDTNGANMKTEQKKNRKLKDLPVRDASKVKGGRKGPPFTPPGPPPIIPPR
jgi:hypothetical protein